MNGPFEAIKVSDRVYWVGAVDWDVRDFHGYATSRGTTYNAYLILADKPTLIDTVKAPFMSEMFSRIASVIEPGKIQYIISNHSEMDHSGCLPETVTAIKPQKVFASTIGAKTLEKHYHAGMEIAALKDGDALSLGNMNLAFVETRMLHWPDSMFSFLAEEGVLFSQDAFGMHLADHRRFADEIPDDVLEFEGAKYYANILLPLSPLVLKLLARVPELNLDIKIIAPDHGPIWRKDLARPLKSYERWAKQAPTRKAVVVHDSMWGATTLMARAVGEGLYAGGVDARMVKLRASHRSDAVTEVMCAGGLVVGSPTINRTIFPTVADFLCYTRGLKPQNLVGAAFGSYGWSGEAVKQLSDALAEIGVGMLNEGLRVNYAPDSETLAECRKFGLDIAARIVENCGG
ncbi:MAG TPA: FprA family A-type flavoprotein [Candidatus Brocadiia bacterium]|nr:FprA family A-type flavoprotein [Candidatus Brocadiia bacterium]